MELKVNEGIIHGAAKSKQRQAGGGQERGEREEKETRGGSFLFFSPITNKRKWENRGFMVVKRRVLGRTGGGEEAMLMWQDLTWRPGGLIFFHVWGRNFFCW